MSYVIGVDGGTESLRAFVFDLDGVPRGSHATAYKTDFPKPSWAEQDPEDWWQALGASVKAALAMANVASGHDLDGRALGATGRCDRHDQGSHASCERWGIRAGLGGMDDP